MPSRYATLPHITDVTNKIRSNRYIEGIHPGWLDNAKKIQCQAAQGERYNKTLMNERAAPFQPRTHEYRDLSDPAVTHEAPSVGQDLWRQLKRVQIPVFTGDKRTYQS